MDSEKKVYRIVNPTKEEYLEGDNVRNNSVKTEPPTDISIKVEKSVELPESSKDNLSSTRPRKRKRYECNFCDKTFLTEKQLKTHERIKQRKRKILILKNQCPVVCRAYKCGSYEFDLNSFITHRLEHFDMDPDITWTADVVTKATPYTCEVCFTKFESKEEAIAHLLNYRRIMTFEYTNYH